MTPLDALTLAAVVALSGCAYMYAAHTVRVWRAARRRRARGAWRQITALAPAGRVGRVEEVR